MFTIEEYIQKEISSPVTISIEENRNGYVLAGLGAGRDGNGCRTSLYHLSRRAAERSPNSNVCLVDFHMAEPTLDSHFVLDPNRLQMSLDSLYKSIQSEITEQTIKNHLLISQSQSNLFLLAGTRRPFSADSFSADVLKTIVIALQHIFDVVIINTSAHFDNPGTIASLHAADKVLFFSNYDSEGLRILNLYNNTLYKNHPTLQSKMLMIGVNNRNVKIEKLDPYTPFPVVSEIPFIKDWNEAFVAKRELYSKNSDNYTEKLDFVIDELLPVDLEIGGGVERKWMKWPSLRLLNSKN